MAAAVDPRQITCAVTQVTGAALTRARSSPVRGCCRSGTNATICLDIAMTIKIRTIKSSASTYSRKSLSKIGKYRTTSLSIIFTSAGDSLEREPYINSVVSIESAGRLHSAFMAIVASEILINVHNVSATSLIGTGV